MKKPNDTISLPPKVKGATHTPADRQDVYNISYKAIRDYMTNGALKDLWDSFRRLMGWRMTSKGAIRIYVVGIIVLLMDGHEVVLEKLPKIMEYIKDILLL